MACRGGAAHAPPGLRVLAAVLAAGGLAACSLGLVDAPLPDPSPAKMALTTRLTPDAADPGWVELTILGSLDPGISEAGERRRAVTGLLSIDGVAHEPSAGTGTSVAQGPSTALAWAIVERFPHPGPRSVRVAFPAVEGLPRPPDVQLLVGVELSPGDSLRLGEGEDLVLGVRPRSSELSSSGRFTTRDRWVLDLVASGRAFHLSLSADRWPNEVRVSSAHLPRDAFPMSGTLLISRARTSADLSIALLPGYRIDILTTIIKSLVVGSPATAS